jgi:2'-5' RNA ligase
MSRNKSEQSLRAFIAVDLPESVKLNLADIQAALKKCDAPIRWVNPHGIHLTLKFLGSISYSTLETLRPLLAEVTHKATPFSISFAQAGVFPHPRNPRVIWLGIDEGAEELIHLQQRIEKKLFRKLKISQEKRAFHPHLTFGRFKKKAPVEPLLATLNEQRSLLPNRLQVKAVVLFESILRPSGAEYRVIDSFSFLPQ